MMLGLSVCCMSWSQGILYPVGIHNGHGSAESAVREEVWIAVMKQVDEASFLSFMTDGWIFDNVTASFSVLLSLDNRQF